jgi:hypothetical protein
MRDDMAYQTKIMYKDEILGLLVIRLSC